MDEIEKILEFFEKDLRAYQPAADQPIKDLFKILRASLRATKENDASPSNTSAYWRIRDIEIAFNDLESDMRILQRSRK